MSRQQSGRQVGTFARRPDGPDGWPPLKAARRWWNSPIAKAQRGKHERGAVSSFALSPLVLLRRNARAKLSARTPGTAQPSRCRPRTQRCCGHWRTFPTQPRSGVSCASRRPDSHTARRAVGPALRLTSTKPWSLLSGRASGLGTGGRIRRTKQSRLDLASPFDVHGRAQHLAAQAVQPR